MDLPECAWTERFPWVEGDLKKALRSTILDVQIDQVTEDDSEDEDEESRTITRPSCF